MRVVLQRVKSASVTVDDQVIGKVGKGYMLLVGFTHDDSIEDIDYIARKVANARLFADENGKINLSIKQVQGAILNEKLRSYGIEVQTGQFGADMDVALVNDGPITIIYDSNQK